MSEIQVLNVPDTDEQWLMLPSDHPAIKAYQFIVDCKDPYYEGTRGRYVCVFCGKDLWIIGEGDHKPDCIWWLIHKDDTDG